MNAEDEVAAEPALEEQDEDTNVAMEEPPEVAPGDDNGALQDAETTMVEDGPLEPTQETAQDEDQTPMTEYDRLRAHLKKNPHDAAAWNRLVEHAEELADVDKIKDAYETLLESYPNTVRNLSLSAIPSVGGN